MKVRSSVCLILAALCLAASPVLAAEIEGVRFSDRMSVGASDLRLHGTGLLRYRVFIKGYVAALYVDESFSGEVTRSSVLADVPRRLEIEYFWSIPARKFADITLEGIAQGTDAASLERLRPFIDQMGTLYRDVEPGDRYALTYIPGVGTELALNGRLLGRVAGAEFSAALFAIWLGDDALDQSLRQQLLAGL